MPPPSRSSSTRSPRPTRPAPRCSCSGAAATWSWPTRASTAASSRSPRPACCRTARTTGRSAAGSWCAWPPARAGTTWWPPPSTRGWVGLEALSGIPGSVGATPIQNVGAYGQEVSQTIASVRVWDRTLRGVRTFAAADCHFGYRHSRFKADPGRHVVLTVDLQLPTGSLGAPVTYAELARTLGVDLHERAPLADVREAVLGLRAGKGMVLDDGRPRHVERRLVLHQPVPHPRAGRRAARRRPALGAARRPHQVERGVAHRARRLRQGLRPRPARRSRQPVDQAHARADQPRGRDCRRPAGAGPRGPRRGRGGLRRAAGQRARARGLRAVAIRSPTPSPCSSRSRSARGSPRRPGPPARSSR